mgnify:CR=1 FL=1
MNKSKIFYKTLSIISLLFGILLILTKQVNIVGAVINPNNISYEITAGFGLFFIAFGIALFVVQRFNRKI